MAMTANVTTTTVKKNVIVSMTTSKQFTMKMTIVMIMTAKAKEWDEENNDENEKID